MILIPLSPPYWPNMREMQTAYCILQLVDCKKKKGKKVGQFVCKGILKKLIEDPLPCGWHALVLLLSSPSVASLGGLTLEKSSSSPAPLVSVYWSLPAFPSSVLRPYFPIKICHRCTCQICCQRRGWFWTENTLSTPLFNSGLLSSGGVLRIFFLFLVMDVSRLVCHSFQMVQINDDKTKVEALLAYMLIVKCKIPCKFHHWKICLTDTYYVTEIYGEVTKLSILLFHN